MEHRIGILGGTFDPIHNGHINLAEFAYDKLKLDKVIFVPSGISYMKSHSSNSYHRSNMVKIAIEGIDYFEYSDVDIIREGNSYTLNTLLDLKKSYKNAQLYFIIGSDTLFMLERWYKFTDIFSLCSIVVAHRENDINNEVSLKINDLIHKYNCEIELMQIEIMEISSSKLRQLIIDEDNNISTYLEDKVIQYINENNLYERVNDEK